MNGLIALAPVLPLLLALGHLAPGLRARLPLALPLAPLPGLVLALAGGERELAIPLLLEGGLWGLDSLRAVFLGFSSLIWIIAGLEAAVRMTGEPGGARFALFWLLALAGNLGLILAFDIASFYTFFSLMTLASYPLIVHRGRPGERRAGRLYLTMALAGEMVLLAGLILAAAPRGLTLLVDLPQAVADSGQRHWTFALLFFGFGVKAGLPLLHFWLPPAYLAAPVPGSVVLSGALINAGLLGWLFTLPLGLSGWAGWGEVLAAFGLCAAFGAVLLGICQRRAKAVLGYSSISQMGLMTLLLGVALADPAVAPAATAAIGLYAMHHGLAKSALFLAVGAAPYRKSHGRLFLLLAALPGLSLAGIVGSGGAAAKAGFKEILQLADTGLVLAPWLPALLSLAAAGTTSLVLVFLLRLSGAPVRAGVVRPRLLAWVLGLLASLLLFWWLPRPEGVPGPAEPEALIAGLSAGLGHPFDYLWPPLLGLALFLAARALRLRAPAIPPGDLGGVLEGLWRRRRRSLQQGGRLLARLRHRFRAVARVAGRLAATAGARLLPAEQHARLLADFSFLALLAALLLAFLLD